MPINKVLNFQNTSNAQFSIAEKTANKITYAGMWDNTKLWKVYQLSDDKYIINVQSGFTKQAGMSNLPPFSFILFNLDTSKLDNVLKNNRDLSLYEFSINFGKETLRFNNFIKLLNNKNEFIISREQIFEKQGNVKWVAVRNKYYCFILKPNFITNKIHIEKTSKNNLEFVISSSEVLPEYSFTIYCGPQNLELLRKYQFQDLIKFSNFSVFDYICQSINYMLIFLHKIIPNWGMCILILGGIIYIITFPLTLKSMSSMKKIQEIQPKIAVLKDKYKDNPQKLSKEQMELFKEHKINPLGGCFPILLQMPVFIGFYQVLWRSVVLKGANFLWIKDLSEPDRLILFPYQLPFIGNEFNLLPFLMGIVMVFQQKFSSRNLTISDPAQLSQQKMMTILLPIMMIFIFYKAASGLTLYFTFFYLLTTFTQWKMSKLH